MITTLVLFAANLLNIDGHIFNKGYVEFGRKTLTKQASVDSVINQAKIDLKRGAQIILYKEENNQLIPLVFNETKKEVTAITEEIQTSDLHTLEDLPFFEPVSMEELAKHGNDDSGLFLPPGIKL